MLTTLDGGNITSIYFLFFLFSKLPWTFIFVGGGGGGVG